MNTTQNAVDIQKIFRIVEGEDPVERINRIRSEYRDAGGPDRYVDSALEELANGLSEFYDCYEPDDEFPGLTINTRYGGATLISFSWGSDDGTWIYQSPNEELTKIAEMRSQKALEELLRLIAVAAEFEPEDDEDDEE